MDTLDNATIERTTDDTSRPSADWSTSTPTTAATAPAITAPSTNVPTRAQETNATRLAKRRDVPLPLLFPAVATAPAAPSTPTAVARGPVAAGRQRVEERLLGVVRAAVLVLAALRRVVGLALALRRAPRGRRERGLVEARVRALEVEVRRRHAQVARLVFSARATSAPAPTAGLLLALRLRLTICRATVGDAQVADCALDRLHRRRGRVYGLIARRARGSSGRPVGRCGCIGSLGWLLGTRRLCRLLAVGECLLLSWRGLSLSLLRRRGSRGLLGVGRRAVRRVVGCHRGRRSLESTY